MCCHQSNSDPQSALQDYDHLARLLGPVLRGLEQLLDAFNWVNVTPMSALLRPLLKLVEARH